MTSIYTLPDDENERLLWGLESIEKGVFQVREVLLKWRSTSDVTSPRSNDRGSFDLSVITWKVKGGEDASESAPFAFDFATDRDGNPIKQKADIVSYIKSHGAIKVDNFHIGLSNDGKFLHRKIAKT